MSPILSSAAAGSDRAFGQLRGVGIRSLGKVGEVTTTVSSTTATFTFLQAVPVGSTVIAYTKSGSGLSGLVTSVADSQGNTYAIDASSSGSASNANIVSAYITKALSTSDTLTVTYGTAIQNKTIGAWAFSGITLSSRLEASGSGALGSNTLTPASLSTTASLRGNLVVACCATAASETGANAYIFTSSSLGDFGTGMNTSLATAYAGGAFYIGGNTYSARNLTVNYYASSNYGLAWAGYKAAP
jgi:hypothetical protein